MIKRIMEADHKRRGLAVIIIGGAALIILSFLSLSYVLGQGNVFSFHWLITGFCSPNVIGVPFMGEQCIVEFSSDWLFVFSIIVIAVGVADRLGLFTSKQN